MRRIGDRCFTLDSLTPRSALEDGYVFVWVGLADGEKRNVKEKEIGERENAGNVRGMREPENEMEK